MTGASARPLSARLDVTPPLTARKAQSSRLRGLNEKVEKLLQVHSTQTYLLKSHKKSRSPQYRLACSYSDLNGDARSMIFELYS